jgi:hypothetical protein
VGCDGFAGVDVSAWLWGAWRSAKVGDVTIARPADLAVIGPVRKRRNLAAEEFTFVRACTSRQARSSRGSANVTCSPTTSTSSTAPEPAAVDSTRCSFSFMWRHGRVGRGAVGG